MNRSNDLCANRVERRGVNLKQGEQQGDCKDRLIARVALKGPFSGVEHGDIGVWLEAKRKALCSAFLVTQVGGPYFIKPASR